MTDIYRQELAIPEKRKIFGWLMTIMGIMMVAIAVIIFFQESSQIDKIMDRPWERAMMHGPETPNTPNTANIKNITNAAKIKQEIWHRTKPFIWVVGISLGLMMVFVLAATINHRLALHLRGSLGERGSKTVLGDPWKEAGEKFKIDPNEKE